MNDQIVKYIKNLYQTDGFIPLHEPKFNGNEKKYLCDCIDSTFVSSVGEFVTRFERDICKYTGAKYAVAAVNGTSALHIALLLAGVEPDSEVITQPLTFVATCNAISYLKAKPLFIDVDLNTLGLSPEKLRNFLEQYVVYDSEKKITYNKLTNKKISACVPMHTFGHPTRIKEIVDICLEYNIPVVEDAAESLGSIYLSRHTGSFGLLGIYSFNGNKTITCGGGGVIVTNNEDLAKKAKHLTTTGKIPHKWEYKHDTVAFNYRMPNLNAALACAQLEQLENFIENKRNLARKYQQFFEDLGIEFIKEPPNCRSNYWLNAIILENKKSRDEFLAYTNEHGVMTRPIWELMYDLEMYRNCFTADLSNSRWLSERVVNLPSSVILNKVNTYG